MKKLVILAKNLHACNLLSPYYEFAALMFSLPNMLIPAKIGISAG